MLRKANLATHQLPRNTKQACCNHPSLIATEYYLLSLQIVLYMTFICF